MTITAKREISPLWDPWDPWYNRLERGSYALTSVEFTVTHLCNLRCEHCAVGESLVEREGIPIPVDKLIRRLDEIDTLETLSLTGGEPIINPRVVKETIQPLLTYAKERGIYTQLNSNLTLPLSRYEDWIEDLDVLHISYNYRDVNDFHRIVFAHASREASLSQAEKLYNRMIENAQILTKNGVFVSAESLLSPYTASYMEQMHRTVVEMGCQRHEVHPLYPSDFASGMETLTLDQFRETIETLLEIRNPDTWVLLGTLPFYPCSEKEADRVLWQKLHHTSNVTVRHDPDGRNRLNANIFSGDIYVTDFADVSALGNIHTDTLTSVFEQWLQHPLAQKHHCFCPKARCSGPNILVADTYYDDWDFMERAAKVTVF
ncbi:radical SAM/CxCxxxxC motif protein YfkAB [Mechercharimyces sp. CAU 1602]|uniref:radical SAM/CxCxxxxC motif protein YfkAB n=1 Tax=Mechercharimyces sp. CAU 1602 TaxID=2973933 RepID=UPI002162BA87|nr:radical SAM/CxCxxxxC motif protein YfkAB [Mechercharimyces sp. CAU 1602]MCS1351821.1 radical SAM/CxCxxxxC motif protein YfkAB [Mechercharimyces sp. CAU 1602]